MGKLLFLTNWGVGIFDVMIIHFLPEDRKIYPIPRFKKYLIMRGFVFKTLSHILLPISDHVDLLISTYCAGLISLNGFLLITHCLISSMKCRVHIRSTNTKKKFS